MGWDRIIIFFIVFDWELALKVSYQEKWDKFIPEKTTDEFIPLY
jgi:hypothetical protein